jgi:hypothetical protein
MNFCNRISPRFDIAEVPVKEGRIERRVSVGTPGLIN